MRTKEDEFRSVESKWENQLSAVEQTQQTLLATLHAHTAQLKQASTSPNAGITATDHAQHSDFAAQQAQFAAFLAYQQMQHQTATAGGAYGLTQSPGLKSASSLSPAPVNLSTASLSAISGVGSPLSQHHQLSTNSVAASAISVDGKHSAPPQSAPQHLQTTSGSGGKPKRAHSPVSISVPSPTSNAAPSARRRNRKASPANAAASDKSVPANSGAERDASAKAEHGGTGTDTDLGRDGGSRKRHHRSSTTSSTTSSGRSFSPSRPSGLIICWSVVGSILMIVFAVHTVYLLAGWSSFAHNNTTNAMTLDSTTTTNTDTAMNVDNVDPSGESVLVSLWSRVWPFATAAFGVGDVSNATTLTIANHSIDTSNTGGGGGGGGGTCATEWFVFDFPPNPSIPTATNNAGPAAVAVSTSSDTSTDGGVIPFSLG